ncbi:MAG: hypothetical protein IT427_17525 [Pirellulales bacterium]|nr:hypothetical protein [Pirellulales bacterium]
MAIAAPLAATMQIVQAELVQAMLARSFLPRALNSSENASGRVGCVSAEQRWLAMLALALVTIAGCGGCNGQIDDQAKAAAKEKLKKEKEQPKPDFELPKLTVVPQKTDIQAIRPVKPGHWTAAVEELKANNFNFNGELYAEVRESGSGKVLDLERTPHKVAFVRPAGLAKGQVKFVETMFFVPGDAPKAWLATELRTHGGSPVTSPGPEPLSLLRAHQYNLVVLAAEGDRYRRMESMDCVRAPYSDSPLHYYQVVAPQLVKPLPLPSSSLAWTTIAYVVWDDVDPQLLSHEQQQALVDWLHWGGQIIISGPKSLDQLRGKSFLGPYLPALASESTTISAETLLPLSKHWTLPERGQPAPLLAPVKPWSGLTLKLQDNANIIPDTAGLVAERRVGRGRIVVTAFRLAQRELWNWPGCDGFWNACLLRRPPRKFSSPTGAGLGALQVDFLESSWNSRRILPPDARQEATQETLSSGQALNPTVVTQVRYLSRDWKKDEGFDPAFKLPQNSEEDVTLSNGRNAFSPGIQPYSDPMAFADDRPLGPGVAGWTDFSDVATSARDSLVEAAGIVIPKSSFVIWVLVLYLIVLVPLNWLVFWALGRIEWAWIAAPIIAIGAMVSVVKLAQLDIGFARAQTEVAVLEAYNGYQRGHLTRYTALYTSLSTSYNLASDDLNTVSLPFCSRPDFTDAHGQSASTVTYQSDPTVELADFVVSSNSTAMLHTEQMLDLGGAIEYSANEDSVDLYNRTFFDLKRAGIVRRQPSGELQVGWIGELAAGRGTKVTFVRSEALKSIVPKWSFALTDENSEGPKFTIDRLANLLKPPELIEGIEADKTADKAQKAPSTALRPGETRLIALIDAPLPGIMVDPAAAQAGRGATLVIVHLEVPPLAVPQPDANCRGDIITGRQERELPQDEPIDELEAPEA